jgi:hypothetical protein
MQNDSHALEMHVVAAGAVSIAAGFLRAMLEVPRMSQVADFHQRQIVATEAGRILPVIAVFVEPRDGHVVACSGLGFPRTHLVVPEIQ